MKMALQVVGAFFVPKAKYHVVFGFYFCTLIYFYGKRKRILKDKK